MSVHFYGGPVRFVSTMKTKDGAQTMVILRILLLIF